jgi:hypothetical protein
MILNMRRLLPVFRALERSDRRVDPLAEALPSTEGLSDVARVLAGCRFPANPTFSYKVPAVEYK